MVKGFKLLDIRLGFVAVLFLWNFALSLLPSSTQLLLPLQLTWALMVALLSLWLLEQMDYFSTFSPFPQRSSWFSVILVQLITGVFSKYFILLVFSVEVLRYRDLFWITPVVVAMVYFFQKLMGYKFYTQKKKKNILALLSQDELDWLRSIFREANVDEYYRWQTHNIQLRQLQFKGTPDLVIISRSQVKDFLKNEYILRMHLKGVPIFDYRKVGSILGKKLSIQHADLWSYLVEARYQSFSLRLYTATKNLLEPAIAALLLFVFFPLLLIIGACIKITSKGPIFFGQVRTGLRGKTFKLYKFRTMSEAPENIKKPQWAGQELHRVTFIGNFLRKSHLDELPQLFNILRGEMSFIGPRPERPEFYEILKVQIPLFELRTLVKPGIAGWAQSYGGYASSVEDSLIKLEYDLFYLQNISPNLDLQIIVSTLWMLVRGKDPKAV